MSFNVSELESYIKLHGKEFAQKVVGGTKTADLLISNRAVILGAKGDNQVPMFDVDANIVDGAASGRNPNNTAQFTQTILKIARFKSHMNIDMHDLYDTYLIEYLAKGQNPESEVLDKDIINSIMERRALKIAEKMEKALWVADKDGTGAGGNVSPYNLFDGILKQLPPASASTGADLVEKLQNEFIAIPVAVSSQSNFRIFMGEDTYNKYKKDYYASNRFDKEAPDSLAGFGAKFEVLPGLNGTDTVVFGRITDLKLGVDKEGEDTEATLKWSIETEKWYMDFNWATGVLAVIPEQFVVVTV